MSFWEHLDKLVSSHKIVIDRPKGSTHPNYPDFIYPLDYGYLEDTKGGDGNEIDVWLGSQPTRTVQAVFCTVDLVKADTEIKLVIGCSDTEITKIHPYHNNTGQQGLLIKRDYSSTS